MRRVQGPSGPAQDVFPLSQLKDRNPHHQGCGNRRRQASHSGVGQALEIFLLLTVEGYEDEEEDENEEDRQEEVIRNENEEERNIIPNKNEDEEDEDDEDWDENEEEEEDEDEDENEDEEEDEDEDENGEEDKEEEDEDEKKDEKEEEEKEDEEKKQLKYALKISKEEYIKNENLNSNQQIELDESSNLDLSFKKEEFDEQFGICPITQDYMKNPVLTPSGTYYEKSAILKWIKKHKNDPITREKLTKDMIQEDDEYRKKIKKYRKVFKK